MRVLLLQLDGKLPNLALMRLAAHHRDRGDKVELRQVRHPKGVERGLWDHPEKVYASLIFQKTRPLAERLRQVYPAAVIGGTGWDYSTTLESVGVTTARHDYSDYPVFRSSMGFTQRGCRLSCSFCVVPAKEGKVKPAATIADLWRGDPWPREVLLLDNDFFGNPHWRERIAEIREGGFKVSFNQGINVRLLPPEGAEAIASTDYRADDMKERRLYTAWDNKKDEKVLFRGLGWLKAAGVRPDDITVYMLIGYWAGETEDDWLYRHDKLLEFGARPYPMPYVREGPAAWFQKWAVRRSDRFVSWADYRQVRGRPEKLKPVRRALELFN